MCHKKLDKQIAKKSPNTATDNKKKHFPERKCFSFVLGTAKALVIQNYSTTSCQVVLLKEGSYFVPLMEFS